ncbi:MAG: NapC/NirT family cytochrome c [Chloroflexi bacterium]|nr:NapC/NirT family cytochrome c [Chloroflexota bacterium]
MKELFKRLRDFFFPPPTAPRWIRILPYAVLGAATLAVLIVGAYGWEYSSSPQFCGTSCHTMPPEYASYQVSPHARINCVECHIGREFVGNQILRKAGDAKHVIALAFTTYEFPITAGEMRPATETCERCHSPQKFASDSMKEIERYGTDAKNTPTSIYLILHTGGGSKREGLGKGIHWHIENKILYYPTDKTDQTIPYVRIYNDDGTTTEYLDVESGIKASDVPESKLKQMDCITCHNRITHLVQQPESAMDALLDQGLIDPAMPEIKSKGVELLRATYTSKQQGLDGIASGLVNFYLTKYPEYYAGNINKVKQAIDAIKDVYEKSVYPEQKADWNSHPNNLGHKDTPGCFRCHDGKHLNAKQEPVRLECNLCHSIPVVAGVQNLVANIEVQRGQEPKSHLAPNWIGLHRTSLDQSCAACHKTGNPGGNDNSSFCSNAACHGASWKFAGLNAPKIKAILDAQKPPAPTPAPTPLAPSSGPATFDNTLKALLDKCTACHGDAAAGGLNVSTYTLLMKGGTSGAVIVPKDSAKSKIVEVQSSQHFMNFSADELAALKKWIDAGAVEK